MPFCAEQVASSGFLELFLREKQLPAASGNDAVESIPSCAKPENQNNVLKNAKTAELRGTAEFSDNAL